MGCGCKERKEKGARWLEAKGHPKIAAVVRKIPSPGGRKVLRAGMDRSEAHTQPGKGT